MFSQIKTSILTIAAIILIITIVSSNLNWGGNNWKSIIEADAKGYYAYLPAVFIYNDLNFGFFDEIEKEKYYDENLYYDYRSWYNGKFINKYYAGTALAQLPFFFSAHIYTKLTVYESDGFSKPYSVAVSVAAIFYLLIGLIFINKLLHIYKINEYLISFSIFVFVFATNLFYYVVGEPGMSHIYSFAFISMFLYYASIFFTKAKSWHIIVLSALLAIICLIRPINLLVLLILPFLASSYDSLKENINFVFKNKTILIISSFVFISIIGIQAVIYKISTNSFIVYSYGEEGFIWNGSNLIDFMFSYKKGIFIYSPLLLLTFIISFTLLKINKFRFYTFIVFSTILFYFLSSWWNWWYGGSFSSRVLTEFLPIFILVFAESLQFTTSKSIKKILISFSLIFLIICQIQTYQYRYYHIHWEEMNKEKYWNVFLRVDKLINNN